MVGLSCFGNFSMGELGNARNLTLNNLRALGPVDFERIDGGGFPCVIPGLAFPQFPNFVIPPFPLFGGIPPFPLFCLLPPFPGIPALSLPGISIPIPPLPFIPPIPLPLPGFALPFLPLLPIFDLGSLSFLCGLINIDLPILDPFAFLNDLINQLNALIAALNDWLQFCRDNAEVINATEVSPSSLPSIAGGSSPTGGTANTDAQTGALSPSSIVGPSTGPASALGGTEGLSSTSITDTNLAIGGGAGTAGNQGGGGASRIPADSINVPTIIESEPTQLTQTQSQQATPTIDLTDISLNPDDEAEDLALSLANTGQIPPIPSIINQVGALLAPFGTVGNLTAAIVQSVIDANNIPSAEGFIGFEPISMDAILTETNNIQELTDELISRRLLVDNVNVKQQVFDCLKELLAEARYGQGIGGNNPSTITRNAAGSAGSSATPGDTLLAGISGLEVSIALNSCGVPFGETGLNLLKITRNDIARAFFIRSTTDPLTADKIATVLVRTGVVETVGKNVSMARTAMDPLPDLLTPTTLEVALLGVIPGPTIGSLKAKCIASTQGITPTSIVDINTARQQALLQSVSDFDGTSFVEKLAGISLASFQRFFANVPFPFPLSIFDLIPLLAIEFEVDDKLWLELFANFEIPGQFTSIEGLFNFLSFVAQTISSQQAVAVAVQSCQAIKENDFNFDSFVRKIDITLVKHGIVLPSTPDTNVTIANVLKIENNFSFQDTVRILGDKSMKTVEELTFLLLATGLVATSLRGNLSESTPVIESLTPTGGLSNSIRIAIKSPSRIAADIIQSSVDIVLQTRQSTSAGIVNSTRVVLEDGVASSGTTVSIALNDFSQTLEIIIFRIGGFIEGFEAIDDIQVSSDFITAFNTSPREIPQSLITIVS